MRNNYSITLILKTLSPFHSSSTRAARVDLDGRIVTDGRNGFPLIRTQSMPTLAAESNGEAGGEGSRNWTPVMPSNSLRHALREGMVDEVFDVLRDKNEKISVPAFAAVLAGSASGNPDASEPTFDEVARVQSHPLLGIFGGGPRLIAGRLRSDIGWAITPATLPLLGDWHEFAAAGPLTQVVWLRREDPVLEFKRPERAEAMIDDYAQAVTNWQESNTDKKRKAKEGEEGGGRGLNAFNAHEVVIPGAHFLVRFSLRGATLAQLGLLLQGLSRMHETNCLGGMGRLGYGQFDFVRAQISSGGERAALFERRGLREIEFAEHDLVAAALEAWHEAKESISAADLEAFVSDGAQEKAPAKTKKREAAQ